ncbi:hypothetical protein MBLNU13_g01197t1 [Cladosporium sp. NU13]
MQIFIKFWGSNYQSFALNVVYPHSLVTVMVEIQDRVGIPWQHQRLTVAGKQLEGRLDRISSLIDYNIKEGDTIECQVRSGGAGASCRCCDKSGQF